LWYAQAALIIFRPEEKRGYWPFCLKTALLCKRLRKAWLPYARHKGLRPMKKPFIRM
jgi:hypothetical protein